MNDNLTTVVFRWMRLSGIRLSRRYLDEQLQSHPDYPSLLSITDTLDELGITNMSLVVDKKKLDELPVPFLAHNPINGGSFIVINDVLGQIKQNKSFEENWDGIVVLTEKPEGWRHKGNENALRKEQAVNKYIISGIAVAVILAILSLSGVLNYQTGGLLLTAVAGMAIAVLIVQQELGISNKITEQLCSAGKETDCNAVIRSKKAKLAEWFSWSDAGIIYFASYLLLLVVSSAESALAIISAAAIPFVFFSAYYQWRVVKKWCTLCLLIAAILILQFVLWLPALLRFDSDIFSLNNFSVTGSIFSIMAVAWLLAVKPALHRSKELEEKNYVLQRFKNNANVFNALLTQQRRVDTAPFEFDLQLGNPLAALQIMVACNPYCRPCAKAHELLHELVKRNDIGLTVRFSVKADNKEDKRTLAVEYLLQLLKKESSNYKRKVLHDWYLMMDMVKFSRQYLINDNENVDVLLSQNEEWSEQAKIQFTPTIFLNGYELPKLYRVEDIKNIISLIRERNIEATYTTRIDKGIEITL